MLVQQATLDQKRGVEILVSLNKIVMTVGGMTGIMLGGYFSTLPDNKMAFFILGCIPIALCIAALNLSKEIDQYKRTNWFCFQLFKFYEA